MDQKNKKIEEIGNRVPFTVPEGYFEDFSNKMEQMTQKEGGSLKLSTFVRPWLYMAAMFVGLLVITNILVNYKTSDAQEESISYDQYLNAQMDASVLADYYLSEDMTITE